MGHVGESSLTEVNLDLFITGSIFYYFQPVVRQLQLVPLRVG